MKKLLLLLAAFIPSLVFAQATQHFVINSQVGKLNAPAKAYLIFKFGANQVVDSAEIVNGKFTITGAMLDPVNAFLIVAHKGEQLSTLDEKRADVLNFFLDKDTITVTAPKDSIYNAEVTGSAINTDSKKLRDQLNALTSEATPINAEIQDATEAQRRSPEFQKSIRDRLKPLQDKQNATLTNYVKTHPDSFFSIMVLNILGAHSNPTELNDLFNSLSPAIKERESAKQLKKSIDIAMVTAIGSTAPDFTQNDINGNPVKLSSFRGKYVLIDFWASWCGPCRTESPNLVRAYNKFKTKNFTILGVSLDRPGERTNWANAIQADKLFWTQVSDLKFWSNEAARLYYISSIPANFLLDPAGKIVARDLRGTDLDAKLEELLTPPNPPQGGGLK